MKRFKHGHVLLMVLMILSLLFSSLSLLAYRIKINYQSYHEIQIAYDLSMIEMKSIQYIQHCLDENESLASYQSDELIIDFTELDDVLRCCIEIPSYELKVLLEVQISDQEIEKIIFL